MLQTIELKSSPDLKKVIQAAFPNYKKHKAFLSVFNPEYGVNVNSYWDGGSRELHSIVELASMRTMSLPSASHPYFDLVRHGAANQENQDVKVDHVGNITLKRLPEGFALVSAGTFCGKPATAHVYLNKENLAKLLPQRA